MERSLVTQREVLALLRVSKATLRRWVRRGAFPAPITVGRGLRWLRSEVERFLEIRQQARGKSALKGRT